MPRRWTDLDSDEYRLPQGLRRVGYDADERRHYFRDGDGRMWRSEPGNEYGVLAPVRPEPPVTIPRRPPDLQPPPPYSKEPIHDPPSKESTSTFKSFTDMLSSRQITSASSSAPKRSHTISIPSVTSLKRSSTTAASFIRSRGKYFIRPGRPREPSHNDDSQRSSHTANHRRITSPVAVTAYMTGRMKPGAEPVNGNPRPPQEAAGDDRHE